MLEKTGNNPTPKQGWLFLEKAQMHPPLHSRVRFFNWQTKRLETLGEVTKVETVNDILYVTLSKGEGAT